MSQTTADLDLTAVVSLRRLLNESDKFQAEQRKLIAEAEKMARERRLLPVSVIAGLMGAGAACFTAGAAFVGLLVTYLHATGRG